MSGTRHRFELTRLEIAGVVVSGAASLFIVFLLGIYAGRGLGERRAAEEARVIRLPVPPASEEAPARDTDLTFDETLSHGSRGAAADDAAPPMEERPRGARDAGPAVALGAREAGGGEPRGQDAAATAGSEHAPEQRGHVPNAGTVDERAAVPAEASASSAHNADAQAHKVDGVAAGTNARASEAGPGGAHPPAHPPDARVAVALAPAPPASGQRGIWSVQVTATREARTADDLVRRLRAKGYEAYIVRAPRQGGMFYRVRVGHYPSMESAGQMVSRLRREPGVPEAFVASD